MFRYTIVACLIWSLLGCYWPAPSKGGYAAHYIFNPHRFTCGGGPFTTCQIQKDRLSNALFELTLLHHTHAVRCFPARYRELRLLGQQIAQEIVAQLYLSAQIDLNLFDVNLRQLVLINTFKVCPQIKKDRAWETLKLRIR